MVYWWMERSLCIAKKQFDKRWQTYDVKFAVFCFMFEYIQSQDGKTPLHMTALSGRFTRAETLIQSGKWARGISIYF